jgi:hypothetical protein
MGRIRNSIPRTSSPALLQESKHKGNRSQGASRPWPLLDSGALDRGEVASAGRYGGVALEVELADLGLSAIVVSAAPANFSDTATSSTTPATPSPPQGRLRDPPHLYRQVRGHPRSARSGVGLPPGGGELQRSGRRSDAEGCGGCGEDECDTVKKKEEVPVTCGPH